MSASAHPASAADCPSDLCTFSECHSSPSESLGHGKLGLRLLGGVATGLALAGVVLPLLPTTPFLLVAAWAFARSSPRLDAWLRTHPRLGPPLAAWDKRRAIPRRAKAVAFISLPASWLMLWYTGVSMGVAVGAGAVLLGVGGWILTRPS